MSITFERLMLNKFKILIVFFFFLNLSCEIHDIEIPINTSIHSWGYIKDGRDSNLYHISYFDNNRFLDYSINWKKKEFRANYGGVNEFISGLNIMEVYPGENNGPIVKNESVRWRENSLEIVSRTSNVRRVCSFNNSVVIIYGTLLVYKHSQKLECNLNNIDLKKDYSRFEFRKNLDEEFLIIDYGNYLTHVFHHKNFQKPKTREKIKSIYYFFKCQSEIKSAGNNKKFDLQSIWKKIEDYSEAETLTVNNGKIEKYYFLPANLNEFSVFQVCPKATLKFLEGNTIER